MAAGVVNENFPVMFIDPVYATVSSRTSNRSADLANEEWIENSGMTGGIIKFSSQGAVRRRENASYFVKMSQDTSTDMVADYMDKAWKLRTPNIILSIISSPDHWKKWMNQRQKEDFQKGIIEAVNTTSMWLLTNGTNSGVCKLIGDAIKMEKERRHLVATNFSTKFITTNKLENLPKITAIGIIPTSHLSSAEEFNREEGEITIELNKQVNMLMTETVDLNPDLTNFIMLDQIKTEKESDNRRLTLEDRFLLPVGKPRQYGRMCDINEGSPEDRQIITCTSTPFVGLLIQGSPSDIEHVCNLIKMKVPVVIVKGTGLATDLFSFAYDEIHQRPEEDHLNSYVKPELLKRIQKAFPDEFKNDVLSRNRCRDMIIECVQFSMRVQQNFLTILDIETDPNGLQNLDKYILLALFESQEPKEGSMFQEQIQSDLKLTIDWNRCDLALSQIFQKYDWINIKISRDLFDLAMIKKDRHKFVELFLDKEAIELHRYFNFKKLLHLINNYEDPEFFRTICLGEVLGYSPITDYPVNKRFIYGDRSALNLLLYKTTYLSALVSFTDFGMEEMENDVSNPATAERKTINTLVYWAALNYDPELTKTLWKKTEEPMAMAIIVNMIWHNMARRWCPDSDIKRKLLASAKEFGEMAVNLLEYSYQDSNFNTIALLDKHLEDFNNKTVIELAHMAKNKHFIAHYVCQRWLNRRWFGNLLIRKFEWGPIKIPNWAKIYLSLVLIFPMFIWITYDLADRKRRDKIMEDDFDDHGLIEEPVPRNTSVFVDKWLYSPTETIAYKMKSVWNYGKERLKVPVHLQFYYLWSAPITKFWLNQIFYILFLILFSVATLYPNCGMIYLDLAVFGWVLMIWLEVVRSTFSKWKKYKELDLFWTVLEIFVMAFLLLVILTVRITPYFVTYFSYPTTKFVMSLGLLYFYYRVLIVFLPISPVLGPMLISIKRMITHDFLTWFRMFLIIMVSGAVTIHSVLYPNYPLIADGIKRALARAFFAMFLTKIDDLEGDTCSVMYKNSSISHCYSVPQGSFYTDQFNTKANDTLEEEEYRRLAKCPHSSLGGYLIVIQYLLIVKLIMVTLLYALFSNTNAKVQDEAEAIWKFQKYSLILDFEEKLILPPPLNFLSYIIMLIQCIVGFIRYIYRYCKGCSTCCSKKNDSADGSQKVSVMMMHRSKDYSYWGNFVKKLGYDEAQEQAEKNRTKTQSQILESLMNKFTEQREFDGRLVEQISNLEQNVTSCQVALEKLQHTIEKLNPHLQPTIDSNNSFIHVLSRQAPYPKTTVQRFPVMDKYVPWEMPFNGYDPAVYTCPVEKFSEQTRPYVDVDYLKYIIDSKVMSISQEDVRDIGSELGTRMPVWNTSSKVMLDGQEKIINRASFITDDEVPIKYQLDICNLPINPKGRTGLRGRGRLIRWGPNHYVMVVISRWKKKDNSEEFIVVDGKRLLEVVAIQKNGNREPTLPRHSTFMQQNKNIKRSHEDLLTGGDYGYMTMYSAVCKKFLTYTAEDTTKQINPDMNETDMIQFFKQFFPQSEPSTPFTTNVIYKGYLDDPSNTDNAWREVEVWNFHFDKGGGDIDVKLKDKEKKWKTVSSYNIFQGSQDLILRQAATLHNSFY